MSDGPTSLEMRVIEKILEMGSGYVLDFSDATFADFFADHGVDIRDEKFTSWGTSKAKRLRSFLKQASPTLAGNVLSQLLEHRLVWKPDGLSESEIAAYRKVVRRLGAGGGEPTPGAPTEDALLQLVFQPELFRRLPLDGSLADTLLGRMEEARRCIDVEAHLSAVILCGSVLEGMCLGFGSRHPERVNRVYAEHYKKPAKQFYEWKLMEWIEVFGKLHVFTPNVEKFGQALRGFRNYVHPAEQLAHGFTPDKHTARIAFQVVLAAAEGIVAAEVRISAETSS
jgi:hypothetical protein